MPGDASALTKSADASALAKSALARAFAKSAFASAWLDALKAADPSLRLRRNYPYRGRSDGVAQSLRRAHPADRYVGIELEVNQRYVEQGGRAWPKIRRTLVDAGVILAPFTT